MNMNWAKTGIDVSKVRHGKGFCPKCHESRRSKTDRELSVDLDRGLFNCHHCGYQGSAATYQKKQEYVKPVGRLEKLSKDSIDYFEKRGISNNTLLRFGISEGIEWMPQSGIEENCIHFNYYRQSELINIKYRGKDKKFKLAKGAELIFYNLPSIEEEAEAVITEGEIDALSFHESGVTNVVSVPNGASKGNQRLEYLDNCFEYFENKSVIVLATDSDEPGMALRDELALRLGKERCRIVDYPDLCKDANDVLMRYGKEAVRALIQNARNYPLDGEVTMDEMFLKIDSLFENGYPDGCKAGIPGFDDLLQLAPGQLTVVTGIPGSGKDEFINWLMTGMAKNHEWSWGIFGFEEPPEIHVTKLIEKFEGKSFAHRKDANQRIDREMFEHGVFMVDKYFHHFKTEDIDATMDGILANATQFVRRYGIRGLLISPWNYIEQRKEYGQSETEYIGKSLIKLKSWAAKYDVHVILIAHPTKLQKDKQTRKYEVPTLYSISGSAHFFNMTHNGITIYRDFETGIVDVHVQKVKWSWLGQIGVESYQYNTLTRQYTHISK